LISHLNILYYWDMFRTAAVLILLGAGGRGYSEPIWILSDGNFAATIGSEPLSSGFTVSDDTPPMPAVINDYSKENRFDFFGHASTVGDALQEFEGLLLQALDGAS
jgi:hypothetical protein